MANITFQYRSKKDNAVIEARLVITIDKKSQVSQYAKTKIEVSKSFWNDYKEGKNFRDITKANLKTAIDTELSKLKKYIIDRYTDDIIRIPDWLKEIVEEYYNPKKETILPDDVLGYWDYYLQARANELKPGERNYSKFVQTQKRFMEFQKATKKGKYLIKDIDESFGLKWGQWCEKQQYAPSITARMFVTIKAICFHAERKGIEVSKELHFVKVKDKEHKLKPIYLSFDELAQIKALTGSSDSLDNVRDWLLISCYTGQRISDFMQFAP